MAKSLCHSIKIMLKSGTFNVANKSFNAIHNNKILVKIFEFRVVIISLRNKKNKSVSSCCQVGLCMERFLVIFIAFCIKDRF